MQNHAGIKLYIFFILSLLQSEREEIDIIHEQRWCLYWIMLGFLLMQLIEIVCLLSPKCHISPVHRKERNGSIRVELQGRCRVIINILLQASTEGNIKILH